MNKLFFILFLMLADDFAFGEKVNIVVQDAVSFEIDAEVLITLTVEGTGGNLEGDLDFVDDKVSGKFQVDLTKIKTGQDNRDEHMRLSLNTAKNKFAYLTFNEIPVKQGAQEFNAELELNGIKKSVSGNVEQKGKSVLAGLIINRKDFNIEIPQTIMTKLGAKVDDKVKIKVQFTY